MRRLTLVLLAAALAVTALAQPAQAATYVRPVTLTVVSNACVYARWEVTLTVTSTRARTVDLYGSSDYGNRPVRDLADIPQLGIALDAGVPYRLVTHPGESAQYIEIGVFPTGGGGWDGRYDPLAAKTVRDPIQTNPRATC